VTTDRKDKAYPTADANRDANFQDQKEVDKAFHHDELPMPECSADLLQTREFQEADHKLQAPTSIMTNRLKTISATYRQRHEYEERVVARNR
jgi:hypothetical protein